MKTFETEYHHIFQSEDYRGTFEFRIHKDLDQIQIATDMDDEYEGDENHIDVNKQELTAIRDLITKVLGK